MVKKQNRIKQGKSVSDDEKQIKSLIIIFIVVVLICVGLYFFTDGMIKKESNKSLNNEEVKINYDIATVGTMFNRVEDEYYVLLYSNEENGVDLNSALDKYRSSDDYIKTYYIDLDLKINSSANGKDMIENPSNSKEVSVTEPTLYKIIDGKVVDCITGIENIEDVLE